MGNLKLSKSVTLTMDNVMVIEQMMAKTKANFSKTLNFVLSDWVKVRTMISKQSLPVDGIKIPSDSVSKQLTDLQKTKVIKE